MKKTVAYLLSLIFFSPLGGEARGGVVDSLHNLLQQDIADTTRVKTLNDLAWELKFTNPDTSITLSMKALRIAEKQKWQKGQATVFRNLGVFNDIKGDYPKALKNYHKALKINKALANSPDEAIAQSGKKGMAITLGYIGIVYSKQGDYPNALEYYFKALRMNKELENKSGTAKQLGNIGLVYRKQGDYPKALEFYLKALAISKELRNKNHIAAWLGNIGVVYYKEGDYPHALEYYFKALRMNKEFGRKTGIAANLSNIGNVYYKQGDYPSALEYYFKALRIKKELGNKSSIANTLGNIGVLYLSVYEEDSSEEGLLLQEEGRTMPHHALLDSAMAATQKSHTIRKQIGDQYGLTFSFANIAKVLILKNHSSEALSYYKQSYNLADTIGALERQKEAARGLYQAYKKMGLPGNALYWHEKYNMHKDSLFNEQKQKELGRQEAQYEWQQKLLKKEKEQEKQKALAQERAQRQRIIIGSVSGGLLLVLIFAGFLYNRFRVTRQQKEVIEAQKEIVDQKNEEITSSITYAQRIQQAVLVPEKAIKQSLPKSFTLLKPQSIVSGDFYYFAEVRDHIIISAIDCTGHGVPGAFMSLIGNDLLNQIVHGQSITSPDQVLNELDRQLEQSLRQEGDLKDELGIEQQDFVRDGMDLAMCVLNTEAGRGSKPGDSTTLHFAGANNPLYLIRKGTKKPRVEFGRHLKEGEYRLYEIQADPQPIGKRANKKPFSLNEIKLQKGDTFYIFSDGYPDQMGGPDSKKFLYTRFRELLLSIQGQSMEKQRQVLDETIEEWKNKAGEDQTDDICVMGVRIH